MSWNITGIGSKAALQKQFDEYFPRMIESTKGTPNESEYQAAYSALSGFVASAPDGHVLRIESWGSAGHGSPPFFNVHLHLDLMAPTFKE